MNTLDPILVVDVNVIIHLEKAGLLDELINDKNVRIVDLVLYQEYETKENLASNKVKRIKQIELNENQMIEANNLYYSNTRNSVFDYYCYVVARDNNYVLLTGDWKLKKKVSDVDVHGAIWYVQTLNKKGIIDKKKMKSVYETWLNDESVFISKDILRELIIELDKDCQ